MFSGRSERPETLGGDKDPNAEDAKEGSHPQWERYSGLEASVEGEVEEDKDVQEFPAGEGGQEAPEIGSGQINQILESISALASSINLLQVQADREQRLPQKRTRPADPLRRAPT